MIYENARYIAVPANDPPRAIFVFKNGEPCSVPIDKENTDYQNIMQLVSEGKLIIASAE